MNEPTIETLAGRLDQVERENRRIKRAGVVALAVIVAVVLMGQATPPKVAPESALEVFKSRPAWKELPSDFLSQCRKVLISVFITDRAPRRKRMGSDHG